MSLLEDVLLSAAEGVVLGRRGVITEQMAGPHSKGTDIAPLQPEFVCKLLWKTGYVCTCSRYIGSACRADFWSHG